jgi:hypothetical protein
MHLSLSQPLEEFGNLSVLAAAAMLQSGTIQGEPDSDLSTPNNDDVTDILDSEKEEDSGALETIITTSIPSQGTTESEFPAALAKRRKLTPAEPPHKLGVSLLSTTFSGMLTP